ncbi:MAG: hypothetical protein Ct9H300mP4_07040 [Gammaproteobacteria bacterium]|nr:MAG: hypothetical protein Ct9H300mP4_07040 [Gammaproteobacteria bacterium]
MRRYTSIILLVHVLGIGTTMAMDGLTPEQEVLYQESSKKCDVWFVKINPLQNQMQNWPKI